MDSTKYDNEKRAKAISSLALRLLVAAYMGYLCFKLWSADKTDSNILAFRIIGGFFLAAAVIFIIYALNHLRIDLKAARINDTGKQ